VYLCVAGILTLASYHGNRVTGTHFRFSVLEAPTAAIRAATLPHTLPHTLQRTWQRTRQHARQHTMPHALPHALQHTLQHALPLAATQTQHDGAWDMHIQPDHSPRDASTRGGERGVGNQTDAKYGWGHVGLTLDGCEILKSHSLSQIYYVKSLKN